MSKVKVEFIRGAVIDAENVGVVGEVAEVTEDQAANLIQAGAAKKADEDAEIGKPESKPVKKAAK